MKGGSRFSSLEHRLGVLIVVAAILPTAIVGWMGHKFTSEYVRSERLNDVGQIADIKHTQLNTMLRRAIGRSTSFLSNLSTQCERRGIRLDRACASKLIGSYLTLEGAKGATLRLDGEADLTVGTSAIQNEGDWTFRAGQLAKLAGTGPESNQSYLLAVAGDGNGLQLAVTFPSSNLQAVFDHPASLGSSGETFLVDAAGYFVTEARYPSTHGREHPISARPMRACLVGEDGETIGLDYKDVEVIHGFRLVQELGTACIMAHIDRAEAFAPLVAMEKSVGGAFAILLLPAILVALYVARRIAKAEDARRASEGKFRLLFDLAKDGFEVLDMQGRIVDINRTAHERLGYTKAEMVGRDIGEFNAPEFAALVAERMSAIRDSGQVVIEAAHVRHDGSVLPVEVNASLVELDGEQRVFSVVRDISERKRLDQTLHLTQFALDHVSTTIAMMHVATGRFIYVNDAACRAFGYTREELLGMTMFDVDPDFSPARWAELNRELKNRPMAPFETTHRTRDGRTYPVEMTANVLEIGGEEYHIGFAWDITERKQIHENLQRSEASLRAMLDSLPYKMWLKDTERRYITINKVYAQHLKLDHPEQAVGKADLDLHPREVAEGYRADDLRVMQTGQQKHIEVQEGEGKQLRWLEVFKTPIIGHDGTLLGTVGFARDITERKAADVQFKMMLRASLDGVWVVDLRGRFLEVNDAYCQLLGYSREELLGMSIPDVEAIEQQEETVAHIRKVMATGYDHFETRHRAKDGRILDVEVGVTYSPLLGGRLYVFLRDITARRRAEDALRESAARLQSHVDNTPMAFVAWDDRYCVTAWSGEAERIFGWSAAETLGKPIMDLHMIYAEDIPLVEQAMAKLGDAKSPYVVSHNRNVTKDGRVIDCVWYNTVLSKKDGSMGAIMSQVLDVTEQKRAEQELKDSEQRFKTLAAATYEGVAMTVNGRMVDANEQMTQIFGYARDELIGMSAADIIAPEVRERVMARILAGQDGNIEHDAIRKDGSRITIEARGHTVRHGDTLIRLTAIRDVSARAKVAEELKGAKAEAERANNAKSRFLAAASHDLRQPLAALKLYVGALKTKLDAADQELLMNMQECVGGVSNLLSKLLDLSKLDAGVIAPRVRNFALDDVLHNVCATHAPEAEGKALRLRCGYFGLTARTDAVLYQRILGNLVANAVRYTERGGVLIACRQRHGKMWVEVWDTGIGIPQDKIGEIFEEFKQLGDDARTYGSGLGLTIVAKTASLLGLQIRVESRAGRGSMFAIELPIGKRSRATAGDTPARIRRGVRIAVVDDNALVLNALVRGLENVGHEVVAAGNSQDLLARLGLLPPAILVCDYRLAGGETGFDVVSAARAAFGSELPAVIITGDTDPKLMRSMNKHGIAILHKPVDLEDLQERIEEAMTGPIPA